jgi:hypothetical protein
MTTTPRPNVPVPDRPPWLPWSAFPFQSRFAEIDGKAIHYVDAGSGPALLFVSAGQWVLHLQGRDPAPARAIPLPGARLPGQRSVTARRRLRPERLRGC